MPRAGAYIVSDLPPDRLCRIECKRCGRADAYRRETLLQRFGNAALPQVIVALTECKRRGDFGDPCQARYAEPIGSRRPR